MASKLSSVNIVELVRIALLKIEFTSSARDEVALRHLKRILLSRLADYEAEFVLVESLVSGLEEISQSSGSRFIPFLSLADIQALEDAIAQVQLQKLD